MIDLASGLFRVKMEVDNADGRVPAGVDVTRGRRGEGGRVSWLNL